MSRRILLAAALAALLGLGACAKAPVPVPEALAPVAVKLGLAADHPELADYEMLVACDECHMEATPDVTRAWYASTHGMGGVKCYQCHGTFEDMQVVPALSRCEPCHADKLQDHGPEMACWQCHPAHNFTGHAEEVPTWR